MMAKVIALEKPEEAIAKPSEMQEIMDPRLADIAFDDARKEKLREFFSKFTALAVPTAAE